MHMLVFISHLSPTHTDDAVDAAACIVEEGHGDGVFARRQPVAFGGRVNLENMSSGAEDRLLPLKHNKETDNLMLLRSQCRNSQSFHAAGRRWTGQHQFM